MAGLDSRVCMAGLVSRVCPGGTKYGAVDSPGDRRQRDRPRASVTESVCIIGFGYENIHEINITGELSAHAILL